MAPGQKPSIGKTVGDHGWREKRRPLNRLQTHWGFQARGGGMTTSVFPNILAVVEVSQ